MPATTGHGDVGAAGDPGEIRLPASVQSLLAARIDRLGEVPKRLLQTAAVIGKQFSLPLLARVLGQPEAELEPAVDDV